MSTPTLATVPATTASEIVQGTPSTETLATGFLLGYRNPRTRAAYTADLRQWFTWCTDADLDPLTVRRPHLEAFTRWLEANEYAAATVARKLAAIAGMYRYGAEEGIIDRNPAAHLRRPSVPNDSPTLGLDRDETKALLAAATEAGPRDLALIALLFYNGLRVSEACAADIEDLGTERGHRVLTVTRKRGRRERIPLAPPTIAAIDAAIGDRTDGALLLANDGAPLDRHDAARIVGRLTRAAGIEKRITPHGLRHTAVTLALEEGQPLHIVQDLAGHADPRTTRRYDRARQSLDRHATYALAGYVA